MKVFEVTGLHPSGISLHVLTEDVFWVQAAKNCLPTEAPKFRQQIGSLQIGEGMSGPADSYRNGEPVEIFVDVTRVS